MSAPIGGSGNSCIGFSIYGYGQLIISIIGPDQFLILIIWILRTIIQRDV